jgi:hypothetical protein
MIPFFVLFAVVYLSCAIALRVAVSTSTSPADQSFGSIWGVLKTLEEATHGPDVKWRAAMEEQPQPAGAIFVAFLWITLIMVSLLIAMFSNTFDALISKVNERLMFRRAMFCVTLEKLFPLWYHQHGSWGLTGCNIGSTLGECHDDSLEPDLPDQQQSDSIWEDLRAETVGILDRSMGYGSTSSGDLLQRSRTGIHGQDRWLLWSKNESTFENWRKPVEDNDFGTFP